MLEGHQALSTMHKFCGKASIPKEFWGQQMKDVVWRCSEWDTGRGSRCQEEKCIVIMSAAPARKTSTSTSALIETAIAFHLVRPIILQPK